MAARSLCRARTDSGFAALIPSLVSSANLDTLLERARSRSLIYITKRIGPKTDPYSGPVRGHTIDDDPLPPSCKPIFNPGSNIALDAQGSNLPHEPFVRDFIEGFAEVQKDVIHGPRTVTLTEHVLVKVKEVCSTRPTLTKTVLARVYEVVCLQEVDHPVLDDGLKDFSWDGSQADGSVVPPVCEETLSTENTGPNYCNTARHE